MFSAFLRKSPSAGKLMPMKLVRFSPILFGIAIVVSGCSGMSTEEGIGTGLGTAGGAGIGYAIGEEEGAIIGGVLGGLAGYGIAHQLTKEEKREVAKATKETAETGEPQTVETESGVRVETQTVKDDGDKDATKKSGKQSKTVIQKVELPNGKTEKHKVVLEKGKDGEWQAKEQAGS